MNTIERQIQREKELLFISVENGYNALAKKVSRREEASTNYGHRLVGGLQEAAYKHLISYTASTVAKRSDKLVRDSILPLVNDWEEGDKPLMEEHPIMVLSNLFAITLIKGLNSNRNLQSVARELHKGYCQTFNVKWQYRENLFKQWGGFYTKLIHYMEELCDVYLITKAFGKMSTIIVSDRCVQWLTGISDSFLNNLKGYKPMIAKPLPHSDLVSGEGGYYITESPLIKSAKGVSGFKDQEFFNEINKHQEVPYCINKKLYKVLTKYLERGNTIADYGYDEASAEEVAEKNSAKEVKLRNRARKRYNEKKLLIVSPEESNLKESTVEDILKQHKNKAVYSKNKLSSILSTAEEYLLFDKFYYAVFLDHRGRRYYYDTTGLNPQGDQLAKNLLSFSNKEAMNKGGVKALFEALGNALGYDKEKKPEKRAMALEWWSINKETIEGGDFSIFFNGTEEMDEPLTALTVALELTEWEKDKEYKTGYIVHQDARCSGIQIQGALQQDAEASLLTGLIEVEGKMPDPYIAVMELALTTMDKEKDEAMTEEFRPHLFKRAVFKYPTMTYTSYGATGYSIMKLNQKVRSESDELDNLSDEGLSEFTKNMIKSLSGAVNSCSTFLNESRKAAKKAAINKGFISFTAPLTGFPVIYTKNKEKEYTIKVRINGRTVKTKFKEYSDELNIAGMASSAPPGIIHSIDAAILIRMGIIMGDHIDLSTIHDSIGSHPNYCGTVLSAYNQCLYEISQKDEMSRIFSEMIGEETKATRSLTMTTEELKGILNATHSLT